MGDNSLLSYWLHWPHSLSLPHLGCSCPFLFPFQASFFRPNLKFSVIEKEYGVGDDCRPQPASTLVDYIHDQGQGACGIVYCMSRDESEHVSQ